MSKDDIAVIEDQRSSDPGCDGSFPEHGAAHTGLTEHEFAAGSLREREKGLALIYNTLRDVIFQLAVEPEGQFRFVSVNAAFLRVTGLSSEAVIGRTVDEVIPEPSLSMVLEKYHQAVEQKTIVRWEETSDYPTGRLTGEVSLVPVLNINGTCTHLVGSVHDITERKRAEATLRESEERFRSMADAAPVMIWVCDSQRLCTFVNKPWLDFTGRTMEEELGSGWASSVHPDDLSRIFGIFASSFESHRRFRVEYRARHADGDYRWVLANATPQYRDREFIGFIGSLIEVTEQKQIEEHLRASEQRLQALAGSLFSAQENESRRVSRELHDEITQQLAALHMEAAAVWGDSAEGPDAIRHRIIDLSLKIGNLADDVHRIAYRLHSAALQDLGLEAALKGECALLSERRELRVQFRAEDVPRSLPADVESCLFKVAQEGLTNVAMHSGASEVRVRLSRRKRGLDLFIKDNGNGFDVKQAISDGGLGLIRMQQRVRMVNGEFKIHSQVGRGTTIEVHVDAPSMTA